MVNKTDALIVICAGNSGRNGGRTILSPGLSKNALTVGASESERDANLNRTSAWPVGPR
jgi:subtilisin family serine protease